MTATLLKTFFVFFINVILIIFKQILSLQQSYKTKKTVSKVMLQLLIQRYFFLSLNEW